MGCNKSKAVTIRVSRVMIDRIIIGTPGAVELVKIGSMSVSESVYNEAHGNSLVIKRPRFLWVGLDLSPILPNCRHIGNGRSFLFESMLGLK